MPWILFWPLLLVLALWYLGVLGPTPNPMTSGDPPVPMMTHPQPQVPPVALDLPNVESLALSVQAPPVAAVLIMSRSAHAVVYSDGRLERELGVGDLLGTAWRSLVHPDELEAVDEVLQNRCRRSRVRLREAGGQVWVPTRWTRPRAQGDLLLVFVEDLTLEEAEERLARSRRTIESWGPPQS